MKYDFIFIRNGDEADLIASNGQVIGMHNNQEHMVGTTYGRITVEDILNHGMDKAFENLWNGNDTRYLLDFEEDQDITMDIVYQCGDYIMPGKNALVNMIYIDKTENIELTQDILISFLKGEDIKEIGKKLVI